jgi:hypothetical protein
LPTNLRELADRIQARAVRRMGELLKQFDSRGDHLKKEGTLLSLPQKDVAESVGISEHQRKQAVRVANVPEEKSRPRGRAFCPPATRQRQPEISNGRGYVAASRPIADLVDRTRRFAAEGVWQHRAWVGRLSLFHG